jgi:hypothetical protein
MRRFLRFSKPVKLLGSGLIGMLSGAFFLLFLWWALFAFHPSNKNEELALAIINGDNKAAQRLLNRGANPNFDFCDDDRCTPLINLAREWNRPTIASMLLKAGAKE